MHSLQVSRSVVSNSLWPHGLQHARLPRPSPTPGTHSNSCPASWWCHPTTSSSVIPFSSCLQSFPASGSFPMSQLFTSGGQSIGASASASVLAMSIRRHSMGLRVCACVCVCSVAQMCPALYNPMDYSPPDSCVHGVTLARLLGWVAISSSRDLPDPGIKCTSPASTGKFFPTEPPGKLHSIT